ncbi:protein FAR-RED IMPAIRED RESPONSE 1-like [Macadamia integrifolia]|uniref:protein FAR-RED IMPAIRED RESPONSE 1-like n=1 Tax=Macadamia integrifolia TaxID=60698 RepID=UPI001C52CCDB|nr:protein FAR-RED IMPAIRED RESPONSE 1-like [Macadamia integrifolia]
MGQKLNNLVKYEASTIMVECSCMKFNFVWILCTHTIKVLDKKNIKRLPSHYILKMWTKDAKIGIIKDHHGVGVKTQVESEIMYAHAYKCSLQLLNDLQDMKKQCNNNGIGIENDVQDKVLTGVVDQVENVKHSIASQSIHGIKTKSIVKCLRKRLKGPLERRKNRKSQTTTSQASTHCNDSQQKYGIDSQQEYEKVEGSQILGSLTQDSIARSGDIQQEQQSVKSNLDLSSL